MQGVTEEAVAEYGRLDVMFANAGVVGTNQSLMNTSSDDFMKTMRTNVLRQVESIFFIRGRSNSGRPIIQNHSATEL